MKAAHRYTHQLLIAMLTVGFGIDGSYLSYAHAALPSILGFATTRKTTKPAPTTATEMVAKEITDAVTKSRIDRFVDKLFDDTDVDHDGTISFQEAYEGILKFYIKLNQQAPIPPPSRDKVLLLFQQADRSHNHVLDRDEYGKLLRRAVRRAVTRLAVHKAITIVGAPLLAEVIVRHLASRKEWLEWVLRSTLPLRWHDKVIPVLTSRGFHRALWITILVATLGNFILNVVNFILDLSLTTDTTTDSDTAASPPSPTKK